MSQLPLDPTGNGKNIWDGTTAWYPYDDLGDPKSGAAYSHKPELCSAHEMQQIQDLLEYIRAMSGTASEIVVTAGANGPVISLASAVTTVLTNATSHISNTTNPHGATAAGMALLSGADAAAQRTSLELGDSATLDVGTTTGTVAAGNDSRFPTGTPAQGDVLYYSGSAWVSLTAGTSGHYLMTQGAGANPVWAANGSSDVIGPASTTENNVPQWDATTKTLKDGKAIGTATGNLVERSGTGTIAADTISEITSDAGVNIDGVRAKDSFIEITEISAPANPAANYLRIYAKDSTGTTKLYFRDSAGVETEVGAAGSVTEASLSFTDITTANATASLHGLLPKLSGTATEYLNGSGAWSTPSGSSSTITKSKIWLYA
jgi:hypothetical protein